MRMPDITMCWNNKCKKKDNCYKHTAKPNLLQSYSVFDPENTGDCKYFWDNREYKGGGYR